MAVWFTLLGLIYYYLGKRLIKPARLSYRTKVLVWVLLVMIPMVQPLALIMRQSSESNIFATILGWVGYLGFGLLSLIVAGLFFRDLYLGLSALIRKISRRTDAKIDFDPERRRFLLNATNVGIIGASTLLTGYGLYEARRKAILEKIDVPIANLPQEFDGFTIAQFTDIHAGPTIKRPFIQSVVDQINHLEADTIVFTGDLVDGSVPWLRGDVAPLSDLYAPDGVFYVTGNHEYYSGAEAWIEEMDRIGLSVLLNGSEIIQRKQARLLMAGVPDYTAGNFLESHIPDPVGILKRSAQTDVKILLAHQPRSIFSASEAGYDLQISGHTHGGQYIPWSYLVTLTQPYVSGLHLHNNTWIYVNRGTGYWGPPLRLGVPSEVTLLTLRRVQVT